MEFEECSRQVEARDALMASCTDASPGPVQGKLLCNVPLVVGVAYNAHVRVAAGVPA